MAAQLENGFVFESEQWLRASALELFEYFSDPQNLTELSPPWVKLRVLSSTTPSIREGTTLDYAIRMRGVPMRWRSLISKWSPPLEFIDEQIRGPFRSWVHHHRLDEAEDGVLVRDRVSYSVVGGALVDRFFVRPELKRIFRYRQAKLAQVFSNA